jgi:cytochrome c biogenesis protein CcmG, thiol:disulfide interchange protein DsbE
MKRFLVILLTVLVFPFLSAPITHAQFSEAKVQEFSAPMDAPDFTLKELDGRNISLKELRGKIIVLNFFTTW